MPKYPLWRLLLLQSMAALTQGVSTTNFSSDIMKELYMWIYKITYADADVAIEPLLNWLSVAILIGSMIAAFTLALTTRFIGYRTSAIVGAIGCAVFNALECVAINPYYTLVMRLVSGYFETTFTMITIIIVGEHTDSDGRGTAGIMFQVFVCVGMLIAGLILWGIRAAMIESNINVFYVTFIAALVFAIAGAFCYWGIDDINPPTKEKKRGDELGFKDMFKKRYIRLLLVSMLLGLLQELTGINSVIVYATETFKTTFEGNAYSSVYGSLIIAAVNIIGTLVALPLINRLGRRFLLYSGTALCVIGTAMIIANYTIKSEISALLITASVIFIFGFELGPGSVFFAYAGELFPDNGKAIFSTVLQVFNFMPNFLVILLFTYLTNAGKYVPFVTYLVGMLACGIALFFLAPETAKKTRQQIDAEFGLDVSEPVVEEGETVIQSDKLSE